MNSIDQLSQLRPSDEALDALWFPAERTAVLDEVLGGPVVVRPRAFAPRHPRRRTVAFGLSAAAVTAVAIAVPVAVLGGHSHDSTPVADPTSMPAVTTGPPMTSASATTAALTTSVSPAPVDLMKPGQFLHVVEVEKEDGQWSDYQQCTSPALDGTCKTDLVTKTPPVTHYRATHESWTAADGTTWRVDHVTGSDPETNGSTNYYKFPPSFGAYPYAPKKFADLPTDPVALEKVLRDYNSKHYAGQDADFLNYEMYDAVHGMLNTRVAPPKLRLAAVQVLEGATGITRGPATTDSLGRPALKFVATNTKTGSTDSMLLDPKTLEIEQESSTMPVSIVLTYVYKSVDVVDTVPADVLQKAVAQN
ncbi:MAG TPA: hypothetical protein VGL26_02330 [Jatrophihabitans sp.]|jgi:hypothetical protein